jgi:hypothetical protein
MQQLLAYMRVVGGGARGVTTLQSMIRNDGISN